MFPFVSANEVTVAVVSFHPTAITFRLPAACADAYLTVTDAELVCGVAYATCTKLTAVSSGLEPPLEPAFSAFPGSPPQAINDPMAKAARPQRRLQTLVERRAGLVKACILVLPQ